MMAWKRGGSQRGAVAVEAALVTPMLIMLLLGIVEMTLLLRDHVAVSSAVRAGARIASAAADAGPGVCETGPEAPPCTPTSSPALAQAAADSIQREGSAMPKNSIEFILVYKANDKGYPGANGVSAMPTSCSGIASCVRFVWRDSAQAFRYAEGAWDSKSINACVNESDALGVYMKARHKFLTGVFGDGMDVRDRTVMKFEPLQDDTCKPGRPAAHS